MKVSFQSRKPHLLFLVNANQFVKIERHFIHLISPRYTNSCRDKDEPRLNKYI